MQPSSPILCLLAILSYFLPKSVAQNAWVYPVSGKTPDPTYNNIDTLNASWTSNYVTPQLLLWCSGDGYKSWAHEINETVFPTGNYLVKLNFSDTTPFGCHFNLASAKGDANMNSPGFNIQVEGGTAKPVTWSNTTDVAKASSTSSATSPPTQTATPTLSPKPAKSKSKSGLGTGAIVGIVIGVLAGAFLLLAALLFWLRSRKHRRQQTQYDGATQRDSKHINELADSDNRPVEKDGTIARAEVEGGQSLGTDRGVSIVGGELEGSGPVVGGRGGEGSVGEAR